MKLAHERIQANRFKRLKQARHNAKLSLTEVANSLSVNKSTLVRWESGLISELKTPHLEKLSLLYGVSEQWLLGYDSPMIEETEEHLSKRQQITDLLIKATDDELDDILHVIEFLLERKKKYEDKGRNN